MSENVDLYLQQNFGIVEVSHEIMRANMKDSTRRIIRKITRRITRRIQLPVHIQRTFFHMTHDIPPPPFFINELKSKYNSNIKPRKHENQHQQRRRKSREVDAGVMVLVMVYRTYYNLSTVSRAASFGDRKWSL